MMKISLLSSFLSLALLAAACSTQKAPPVSSSPLAIEQQGANEKSKTLSEQPTSSALKSLTWTRSGGGNIQFMIEQGSNGSGFTAKVMKYDFQDREESFAIESESMIDGLKAVFSGKVKIEGRETDPSALTGTWMEVDLLDSSGKSETLKSPMIQDEKYSKTLENLEDTVRKHMKILDEGCFMIAPKKCSDLTDLSGTWVSEERNENGVVSITEEITLLENISSDVKKYTLKKTVTDASRVVSAPLNYILEYDSSACILLRQTEDLKTSVRRKVLEISQDGKEIKSGVCEDEKCQNVKNVETAKRNEANSTTDGGI
ncbi:MAG: hypothetical protein KGP28_09875 [Bdellovibrionales bacterium]|nr:hypothetical protein [Bdellovibrionales bacterium]